MKCRWSCTTQVFFDDETMRYVLEKNPKVEFPWGNCAEDNDNWIKKGAENLLNNKNMNKRINGFHGSTENLIFGTILINSQY